MNNWIYGPNKEFEKENNKKISKFNIKLLKKIP